MINIVSLHLQLHLQLYDCCRGEQEEEFSHCPMKMFSEGD